MRSFTLHTVVLLLVLTSFVFAQYSSDLCEGGTVSASSYYETSTPDKAFDDTYSSSNNDNLWASDNGTMPEWLQYDFGPGNEKTIVQYRFYTSDDKNFTPRDWTFQGSNDGSSWDDLDSYADQDVTENSWHTCNSFSNSTAYRYYRFYVTSTGRDGFVGDFYVDVEEMEMMEADNTEVTFINGANGTLDFQQTNATPPENDWLCGQFSLTGSSSGATLNSVTVTLGGAYDPGDLQSTPFQLYASNTNSFGGASLVGSSFADPGSGSDLVLNSLADAIPAGTRYYWVTADISASATGDDTINGTVNDAGDLNISGGTISGSSNYGKLNASTDASLPVALSSFSAKCNDHSIILEWTTESEMDNIGFIVERSDALTNGVKSNWQQIASYLTHQELASKGNSTSLAHYSLIDTDIMTGVTYFYRLSDKSSQGDINTFPVISVQADALPDETRLDKAYPNPFNPQTLITYHLSEKGPVTISVYDILGRPVKTLINKNQSAGSYQLYWDATNQYNKTVSSGAYFIRMNTQSAIQIQKVLYIK